MYDVKSMWIDDCLLNSLRSWEKSCRKILINCLLFCVTSESILFKQRRHHCTV